MYSIRHVVPIYPF